MHQIHIEPIDVYNPAAPGSLKRTAMLHDLGVFRLARRTCMLSTVQIWSSGSWVALKIWNGKGRLLFNQLSTFTGSFVVGGEAEDGLVVQIHGSEPPQVSISYQEQDAEMI